MKLYSMLYNSDNTFKVHVNSISKKRNYQGHFVQLLNFFVK